MMKWIRWRGIVAFIGVLIILSGFWFFFIDGFIGRMIEKTGTRIIGARVDLDHADFSIFPAGLILTRLQVTDPDEPMKNAFEVARAAFSIDTVNLFRRKVIIDEMTLDGLEFDTPRKTSGALPSKVAVAPSVSKKVPIKEFKLPLFEVPDVQEILKREELQSLKLVESLRADIKKEKDNWQTRLQDLPDKKKVDKYKSRIDKVKSARKGDIEDILGALGEVKTIKKDLERDIRHIKGVQKEFEVSFTLLEKRLDQAVQAPKEDAYLLKEKYSLSPQGLGNISQIFFGPKVGQWVERTLVWYKRLKPVLERAKERKKDSEVVKPIRARGVDVRFKEHEPMPDFLIRQAKTSLQLSSGNLSGKIKNITPDQDVLGAPLSFAFSGDSLKGVQSVKISGTLDHVVPSSSKDTISLYAKGYQINDAVLSDSDKLPITLKKGLLNLDALIVISGEGFRAKGKARLKSAQLLVEVQDEANLLAASMRSALSEISGFTLHINVHGRPDKYDIHLTSDLDDVLKGAVSRLVQDQALQLERELNSAILEKVGEPLSELKVSLTELETIDGEITARLNQLNRLLGDISAKSILGDKKLLF
ncbi:MAG: TIGR03545 family protein [Deltaproteobacteria bacterium]|nr:TIGR03545 family protein [Deltaproteobacteria bacterium]